jgi:hypothetical protein
MFKELRDDFLRELLNLRRNTMFINAPPHKAQKD